MRKFASLCLGAMLALSAQPAAAAEISTHVLDLAKGVGGQSVPVTLSKQLPGGRFVQVSRGQTDYNGRIASFGDSRRFGPGVYKLQFDMARYPKVGVASPFFPEIDVVFQVTDGRGRYHVPVVVSPYGYSTYRGN